MKTRYSSEALARALICRSISFEYFFTEIWLHSERYSRRKPTFTRIKIQYAVRCSMNKPVKRGHKVSKCEQTRRNGNCLLEQHSLLRIDEIVYLNGSILLRRLKIIHSNLGNSSNLAEFQSSLPTLEIYCIFLTIHQPRYLKFIRIINPRFKSCRT